MKALDTKIISAIFAWSKPSKALSSDRTLHSHLSFISEESIKEILTQLSRKQKFIIEELDRNHLFVESASLPNIVKMLEEQLEENIYKPPIY